MNDQDEYDRALKLLRGDWLYEVAAYEVDQSLPPPELIEATLPFHVVREMMVATWLLGVNWQQKRQISRDGPGA